MTSDVWKPTAGRDAMTRDGDRVTGLHDFMTAFKERALRGTLPNGEKVKWWPNGRYSTVRDTGLDLVADWPDADPLPDAGGWRKHTPGPCPVDPETEIEVVFTDEKTRANPMRGTAGGFSRSAPGTRDCWTGDNGGRLIGYYRIVRPTPSGPVVEETVRRIVPGVYGIVEVTLVAEARVGSPTLTRVSIVADTYSSTDILAAAEILRQIGEAMASRSIDAMLDHAMGIENDDYDWLVEPFQ